MSHFSGYSNEHFSSGGEMKLLFTEDVASNALLQIRVHWKNVDKIHEKPYLIFVNAYPQSNAGTGKTYLAGNDQGGSSCGVSFKFSVSELSEMSFALQDIAAGTAVQNGIDQTWVKWADSSKAKTTSTAPQQDGRKRLSIASVQARGSDTSKVVNLAFTGPAPDIQKIDESRRATVAHYVKSGKMSIVVTLGVYQALAFAQTLASLVNQLQEIERQWRLKKFRQEFISGNTRNQSQSPPANADNQSERPPVSPAPTAAAKRPAYAPPDYLERGSSTDRQTQQQPMPVLYGSRASQPGAFAPKPAVRVM